MKFTAIVVTYNEASRLRECLASLLFCDQIIVFDLGSMDESVEIARQFTGEVYEHEHVPVVEMLWPEAIQKARNEWILRLDPDEVFPPGLVEDLERSLPIPDNVGMLLLPHQYYFLRRPLHTTIWGGIKYVGRIFHRDRVEIRPIVHQGLVCKPGFISLRMDYNRNNIIKHYWIDTVPQLLSKHRRYIQQEGKARYDLGERFSWLIFAKALFRALGLTFIKHAGWRGGFTGVFLSFFYIWYVGMSWLSLRSYQKQVLVDDFHR